MVEHGRAMIEREYLEPGRFADSDAPDVIEFAHRAAAGATGFDAALRLYSPVRDEIRYDAYVDCADPNVFRASTVLARKTRILRRQGMLARGFGPGARHAEPPRVCRRQEPHDLAAAL